MFAALISGLVTAPSLLVVDLIIPGVNVATFPVALIAAAVIAIGNAVIHPVMWRYA